MSATFFDVIWAETPGSFGEIRKIKDGKVVQSFVPLDGLRGLNASSLAQQGAGYNVYFGVLPRVRGIGTAADVPNYTDVLWADVDAKKFSSNLDSGRMSALAAVSEISPSPQILVASGGGYQAYWFLDRRIEWDYAKSLMQGIARHTRGDAVYDKPRVLRVPGTLNIKYDPPIEARILRFDLARSYRPGDFDDLIEVVRPPRPSEHHAFVRNEDLPRWLLELVAMGAPKGERSEACFKAAIWLVRYGRSDEEITQVFESTPGGIGAKYHEKGHDGPRWLSYTLKAARERA